jgi:hypothetical protein
MHVATFILMSFEKPLSEVEHMTGLYVACKNVRNLLQQSLRLPLTSLTLCLMSVLVCVCVVLEIKSYNYKALYNKSDTCNNTQSVLFLSDGISLILRQFRQLTFL